ncbi:MAG TPA: hypothetical protein VIB79_11750 [Candidatus Binatia bacterium]
MDHRIYPVPLLDVVTRSALVASNVAPVPTIAFEIMQVPAEVTVLR